MSARNEYQNLSLVNLKLTKKLKKLRKSQSSTQLSLVCKSFFSIYLYLYIIFMFRFLNLIFLRNLYFSTSVNTFDYHNSVEINLGKSEVAGDFKLFFCFEVRVDVRVIHI